MAITFLNSLAVDTDVLYVDAINDRVGIGTTSPSYDLHVSGTTYSDGVRSQRYYGSSGTSSYLDLDSNAPYALLASSEVNITNDIIGNYLEATEPDGIAATNGPVRGTKFYTNNNTTYFVDPADSATSAILNGKVGIGTSSPSAKLEVKGSGDGDLFIGRHSSTNAKLIYGYQSASDGFLELRTAGDVTVSKISGYIGTPSYFKSNVGIGTSSPSSLLHVLGSPVATNGALITARNSDATSSNTTFGGIMFNSSPGTDYSIGKSNVNTATTLSFRNANTGASYMDIDSSGNVGIGTNNPSTKLHVYESNPLDHITIDGNNGDNRNLRFATENSTRWNLYATGTSETGSNVGSDLSIARYTDSGSYNGNVLMILRNSGYVGINTSSPSFPLEVYGGTGDGVKIKAGNTSNDDSFLIANSSDTTLFVVDGGGQVGIGTSSPSSYLEVETAGSSGSDDIAIFSRSTGEVLKISREAGEAVLNASSNLTLSADYDNNTTSTGSNVIFKTDASERMRITSGGSIGVGISSPTSNGGSTAKVLHIHNPNTAEWAVTHYTNGSTGSGGSDGLLVGNIGSDGYLFNYESANLIFGSNGAERMRITSGGYVQATDSFRAPIFYDSNNTAYYLNPADSNLSLKAYGEICNSNYAEGNLNAGSLNIGRTDTNYIFGGYNNWPSDVRLGILANCANDWEFGIHDSGTSVESVFLYQNSSGLITMGRDLGWGSTPIVASSSFRAPIFYDSNNTGYYLDPASTGRSAYLRGDIEIINEQPLLELNDYTATSTTNLNAWVSFQYNGTEGGYVGYGSDGNSNLYLSNYNGSVLITGTSAETDNSFRAPIFYDSNDTNYYVHPGDNSQLRNIYYNSWLRNNNSSSSGLYWETGTPGAGWHIYPLDQADMYIRAGSGNGSLRFTTGNETARGYVHWTTSNEVGFLNSGRNWSLRVDNSGNTFATSSHRAPIFYDTNNTSYYVNPASNSKLYQLSMFGHSINSGQVMLVPDKTSYSSGGGFTNMTYRKLNSSLSYVPETVVSFQWNTTQKGSIGMNAYGTQFNTSSDYRLKENAVILTDGIQRVKQLQPKRFNFIGFADQTLDGFLAHEVSDIVPEAVTGEKDAVDENNDPVHQVIDQSKIVPLLTAALKEAISKIEDLETRIQILENQ